MVIARKMGSRYACVVRWLAEIGIEHRVRITRPRDVVPTWVAIAVLSESWKRQRTRLYEVWASMRKRCMSPTVVDYPRYGGRGITICEEWREYFGNFRAWAVSSGYRKGLTIDRKDSNGNYEPANCRWVTKGDQQANTRWAVRLTVDGVTRSIYEWSRISGIAATAINGRARNGWPHKEAVYRPLHLGRLR